MIQWTIKRVLDAMDQPSVSATSTLSARRAMLAEVEKMLVNQPDDTKAATQAAIPALATPADDRWRQYIIYLGNMVGSTSYVLVEAVRTEKYP